MSVLHSAYGIVEALNKTSKSPHKPSEYGINSQNLRTLCRAQNRAKSKKDIGYLNVVQGTPALSLELTFYIKIQRSNHRHLTKGILLSIRPFYGELLLRLWVTLLGKVHQALQRETQLNQFYHCYWDSVPDTIVHNYWDWIPHTLETEYHIVRLLASLGYWLQYSPYVQYASI